jgi:multicomponent Na+:H+ antiporter subunit C
MVSLQSLAGLPYALIVAFALIGAGLAASAPNLLKRIVGVAMIWTALALFLVASGVLAGAEAPILPAGQGAFGKVFSNPLQQSFARAVLIAGAAGLILALAIVVRIREAYGSIEGDAIEAADRAQDDAESKA